MWRPLDFTWLPSTSGSPRFGANWVDEIWANVEVIGLNTITCIGLKKVANLFIERLPTAHPVSPFRECDDDDDYSYIWEHIDENNTMTVVGATPSISVSKGGRYTLTATALGALACTSSKSIEILTSEVAKLTEKDIVIGGFSSTENTIEILVDNLGVGDYEFALDDGGFQDDSYITQVRPGIRTVNVRDKMGCGVATVTIGVVGYYKYFSPNNDGINDTWKILGLKTTFNSQSNVYIYDRYGRFLTQVSGPDESWDGSYQGQPLPADDYWFRLELKDGRIYTGHFSLMR